MARNRNAIKQSREANRKKRNTIIIGVILVALMIFSVIGYGNNQNNSSGSNKFSYNGFDFEARQSNNNIIFVAEQNGREIGFFYFQPKDTEEIPVTDEFKQDFITHNTIVISSEPLPLDGYAGDDEIYKNLILQHLNQYLGKTIIEGVTKEDLFGEKQKYTCEDASPEILVLIIESGETTEIKNMEVANCYSITATGIELLKIRDKLLYIGLGVQ